MASVRKKGASAPRDGEEPVEAPVGEVPQESSAQEAPQAPVGEERPAEEQEPAPAEETDREMLVRLLGPYDEREPPSLVRFEQRSGRPCEVFMDASASAVSAAWAAWVERHGRDAEGFAMAVLDARDAWPARIMRPCTSVRLD